MPGSLPTALLTARLALLELRRGRAGAALVVVAVALLALLAVAANAGLDAARGLGTRNADVVGATLLGAAAFVALLLGAVVGVMLGQTAIRGDAERGQLQPVLARPVSRAAVLAGRLLASAAAAGTTAGATFGFAVLAVRLAGGYAPPQWAVPLACLACAAALTGVLAVALSSVLPAAAAGIASVALLGLGFTVGLLGQLGASLALPGLSDAADVLSVLLPFEALYRHALHGLAADVADLSRFGVVTGPFGGARALTPLMAAGVAVWTGCVVLATGRRVGGTDF